MASVATLTSAATPAPVEPSPPTPVCTTELSVLTYNIRGLPWPLASGRGAALKEIGRELALMRREGRQPDVVLIQEGFRGEVADLVKTSGYRYWVQGPSRSQRPQGAPPEAGKSFPLVRYLNSGEGWGKFTGGGLHVLSDIPIVDVLSAPYRYCAGLDCLANKGVMLARLALPGVPTEIDVVNTHMNSKGAAKVPRERSLQAHNLQTRELINFISANAGPERPLLVGGDFNVRNAPARYEAEAQARPYKVVSEFCNDPAAACQGQAPEGQPRPWLRSQDLQGFQSAEPVEIRPTQVATLFGAAGPAGRLSDHDGYLVRYRLSWSPDAEALRPPMQLQLKPTRGAWGVKVSWRR